MNPPDTRTSAPVTDGAAGAGNARRAAWVCAMAVGVAAVAGRIPLLAAPGFMQDQVQFIEWGFVARTEGLAAVYDFRPTIGGSKRLSNYPPLQNIVCRILAGAYGAIADRELDAGVLEAVGRRERTPSARAAYALFKIPAVVADAALAALLCIWVGRRYSWRFGAAVGGGYALLPNVWHNSAVWGAVDAWPALLVCMSLEMARRGRRTGMWAAAALAVLTKPQALVFAPIWIVATLKPKAPSDREIGRIVAVVSVIAIALVVPFAGQPAGVWDAYGDAAGFYPLTHLNGFSAWFLGSPLLEPHLTGDLAEHYLRDDIPGALGMTPRTWGLVGFAGVVVFLVRVMWRRSADEASVRRAAMILPLAFFVLSTQMHERYLYPAVAVWAWAAWPTLTWWIGWIALALCAAVNVLWTWVGPFDGVWASGLSERLHSQWLGAAPGVWVAWGLVAILVMTLASGGRDTQVRATVDS